MSHLTPCVETRIIPKFCTDFIHFRGHNSPVGKSGPMRQTARATATDGECNRSDADARPVIKRHLPFQNGMVWARQNYPERALLSLSDRTARLSRQQKKILCMRSSGDPEGDHAIHCEGNSEIARRVRTNSRVCHQISTNLPVQEGADWGTPTTTRSACGTFGIFTSSRNKIHWKPALPMSTLMKKHEP